MAHALRLDHDSSRALRFFQRSILRATFRRWRAQVHPVHVFVRDPERLFSRQCDAFRFADVHGLFRLDFVRLVENCPLRLVRTRANTVEGTMPVSDFIARCVELRDTKAKDPPPPDIPEPAKGKGGGKKK